MTKLEKSIRSEMKFWGPRIRAGYYVLRGHTGDIPKGGTIKALYASYEDGVVTDIRLYLQGDAWQRRDYEGWEGTVDITKALEDYIRSYYSTWDDLIEGIAEIVLADMNGENDDADENDEWATYLAPADGYEKE